MDIEEYSMTQKLFFSTTPNIMLHSHNTFLRFTWIYLDKKEYHFHGLLSHRPVARQACNDPWSFGHAQTRQHWPRPQLHWHTIEHFLASAVEFIRFWKKRRAQVQELAQQFVDQYWESMKWQRGGNTHFGASYCWSRLWWQQVNAITERASDPMLRKLSEKRQSKTLWNSIVLFMKQKWK